MSSSIFIDQVRFVVFSLDILIVMIITSNVLYDIFSTIPSDILYLFSYDNLISQNYHINYHINYLFNDRLFISSNF